MRSQGEVIVEVQGYVILVAEAKISRRGMP